MDWTTRPQERIATEKLVEDLLFGSEVLDRKRSEVKRLVSGLVGLMRPLRVTQARSEVFRVQDFEWWVFPPVTDRYVTLISARLQVKGVGSEIYSSEQADALAIEHIEIVREHLPMLVYGLVQIFPGLKDRIRPIVDAARKARS